MKRIVIAPYLMHKELLKLYRKDDPFVEVKMFTRSSFLSNYYYQYGDDALLYVTSKFKKDFDIANQILQIVSKMKIEDETSDKFNEIIRIKQELRENNLLSYNEYFEKELENSEIDVYFYSQKDTELNKYLNDKKVNFIKFDNSLPNEVQEFNSNNEELSYVFNEIARLLDQGVNGNKIAIYGLSEDDELIYSRLIDNYKFHINNAFSKTFLSKVYVNRFLANIIEVGVDEAYRFEEENSYNDETFVRFTEIVKKYHDESLLNLPQSEVYQSLFSKEKLSSLKYEDGIEVVNEPICPKDGYLFITSMVQGKFPNLVKDNGYISDNEKIKLGINTTEEENKANYELYMAYLRQGGHIYLSYSKCSFSAKYYPSPLIKSLSISVNTKHKVSTYYSFDEAQVSYANELDIEKNYLHTSELLYKFRNTKDIKIPYQTYDCQPVKIDYFTFDKVISLSYSSTTTYYECAFKFYLNNVLKVDEIEDNFSLSLGKLAHNILENIDTNKSFDELYEFAYEKYKDGFSKDDWVFLRKIKVDLNRVFDFVKEFESQVKDSSFLREKRMSTYLDDVVELKGVLDKVIVSNDKTKVAVVDYKTGKTEFSEPLTEYGLSLQLPTYSLLLKNSKDYIDSEIYGLFLEPLLLPTKETLYSRVIENDLNSFSKLDGLLNSKDESIQYFDSSEKVGNVKYLTGIKYKNDGTLTANSINRLRSKEYFDGLALLAEKLILEAGHNILNNHFEINPKKVNGEDASCKYCPFKDICYRDESSYVKINTKKDNEEEKTSDELN